MFPLRLSDGSFFGEARLGTWLKASGRLPPGMLVDGVLGAVKAFTIGASPSDDITALAVRLEPVSAAA